MSRSLRLAVVFVASVAWPLAGMSQVSSPGALSVGVFVTVGFENHDTPAQLSAVSIPLVGIYGEVGRHRYHAGVDIRAEGGTLGIRGLLVGPRLSTSLLGFHPYVEGLAGPNHTSVGSVGLISGATKDRHGVTVEAAIGIDLDVSEHIRWRAVEVTAGRFSGIPDSRPVAFTTGFVFHLP